MHERIPNGIDHKPHLPHYRIAEKTTGGQGSRRERYSEYYSQNPFISSTNENLTVQSKQNPIYQINIDNEKFTNFVDSFKNSELISNLSNCLGEQGKTVDTNEVVELVEKLPALYVEVDNNDYFTRLYFTTTTEDDTATITADFDFTYPENINVSEPVEYQNLFDALQKMVENANAE